MSSMLVVLDISVYLENIYLLSIRELIMLSIKMNLMRFLLYLTNACVSLPHVMIWGGGGSQLITFVCWHHQSFIITYFSIMNFYLLSANYCTVDIIQVVLLVFYIPKNWGFTFSLTFSLNFLYTCTVYVQCTFCCLIHIKIL